jgi:hypothetical protein
LVSNVHAALPQKDPTVLQSCLRSFRISGITSRLLGSLTAFGCPECDGRALKSGLSSACRSSTLAPAPLRFPSTGEHVPSCQDLENPSTILVLCATEYWKKVLNLFSHIGNNSNQFKKLCLISSTGIVQTCWCVIYCGYCRSP